MSSGVQRKGKKKEKKKEKTSGGDRANKIFWEHRIATGEPWCIKERKTQSWSTPESTQKILGQGRKLNRKLWGMLQDKQCPGAHRKVHRGFRGILKYELRVLGHMQSLGAHERGHKAGCN